MINRRNLVGAGLLGAAGAAATFANPKSGEALSGPAISRSRRRFNMVTTWPKGLPGLGTGAERLAKRIGDLTEGAINVQYFAAGERVGAFDSFDAVAAGNAQAYHAADYYWKGKHPGFAYFAAVPFGLVYVEQNAWLHHMGGQQLWDEVAGSFGLKCFAAGNTGLQMGGWFNKEINSAEDLKGLKMRIPGIGGDMMAKLGVSVVSLPGGQIYEALVSGAIDACEWVGPWNDYFLKFYEAAKYYYWPGVHEPGSTLSFGINASWFGGLTKSQQILIEAACTEENDKMMAEFNANNGIYLTRLRQDHGVQLRRFNEDVYDAFGEGSQATFDEIVQHSDLAKRIHESFVRARKEVGGWMNLSDVPYLIERNRVLGIE